MSVRRGSRGERDTGFPLALGQPTSMAMSMTS